MDEFNLKRFFMLENHETLFKQAITPKSCGGGDQFKYFALLGDYIINLSLFYYFSEKGIKNSGILTSKIMSVHNEWTLCKLGEYFEIVSQMVPLDPNHKITDKELKECIEALIGLNYKIHDLTKSEIIIKELMNIIEENQFFDLNPIGELIEFFQKNGKNLIFPDAERVGGKDHAPLFCCTIKEVIFNKEFHIISEKFSRKCYARKDAAQKFLAKLELTGKNSIDIKSERKKEISKSPTQSLSNEDLNFSKSTIGGGYFKHDEFQLSSGTSETLYDWAKRKSIKNPFSMLLLLNARLDDVTGSSWHASLPTGDLILLNISLKDQVYFEIGFAESKNKAKKEATRKIIDNSKLFEWLKTRYENTRI